MAATLTSTGITIDSLTTVVSDLTDDYESVYGTSINLSPSTPDGQMLNIYAQGDIDTQEWGLQIFTQFDPDQAVGVVLDQRCAINGIQREMGTSTVTPVSITVSQTVTLYGQDQSANPVYTLTDNVGSVQWNLITTITLTIGTYSLPFSAALVGPTVSIPGTISVPVTVVLGVTNINNPLPYTTLGVAQESDAQFKIRRQQSTAIGSQGYYAGLIAMLQNISGIGVGNVAVYENDTGSTSTGTVPPNVPAGIPSHSIWVVVGGGAASQAAGANGPQIAQAIYAKRNSGCGMLGAQSFVLTRDDTASSLFSIFWDVVQLINPFVNFAVGSINNISLPNILAIYAQLPTIFTPSINQLLTTNQLSSLVNQIDPNTYVSSAGFALAPYVFTCTSANATVGATYTNSGHTYTVLATIAAGTTLLCYGPASPGASGTLTKASGTGDSSITYASFVTYTATLLPAAGNYQFQILSSNLVVTPMILSSPTSVISISAGIPLSFTVSDTAAHGYVFTIASASVTNGATYTDSVGNIYTTVGTITSQTTIVMSKSGTATTPVSGTLTKASGTGAATLTFSSVVNPSTINFVAQGGYQGQALAYSIPTNNSGASITSAGVYTAGPTPATDTVKVLDAIGNFATVSVVVS